MCRSTRAAAGGRDLGAIGEEMNEMKMRVNKISTVTFKRQNELENAKRQVTNLYKTGIFSVCAPSKL